MPNTNSTWTHNTGQGDAKLVVAPQDMMISFAAAADAVLTRNAAGDWSWNQIASKTNIYSVSVSRTLERLGLNGDFQETFGTATPNNSTGGAQPAFVGNQGGPQSFPGRPPQAGASFLAPVVGSVAKGFKLTDVSFVYLIGGAALTAITCRVDKTVYANNVANAITPVLATGANGLATAIQANPYVTKVATPNAIYNVTDNSDIIAELSVQTQAAGTCRIYRMILHGTFNYN